MVLDLYKQEEIGEFALLLIAALINIIMMLLKTGKMRVSKEHREAWREHGKHDKYMTIRQLKETSKKVLPGVVIKRHFFWRYSLIWIKNR